MDTDAKMGRAATHVGAMRWSASLKPCGAGRAAEPLAPSGFPVTAKCGTPSPLEPAMSRIFGPIYQNGYVVENVDAAINSWVNVLGVGPFFRASIELDLYRHRGKESLPVIEVALAYSGELQIELIQQVNDAPSAYLEFLARHGPGLQHVSVLSRDFDVDVARYRALGYSPLTELKVARMNRAVFYDFPSHAGAVMEVAEDLPAWTKIRHIVRQASIGWDGTEPVRWLGPQRAA